MTTFETTSSAAVSATTRLSAATFADLRAALRAIIRSCSRGSEGSGPIKISCSSMSSVLSDHATAGMNDVIKGRWPHSATDSMRPSPVRVYATVRWAQ
eukprot:3806467-Prymnesium_polylepis.1